MTTTGIRSIQKCWFVLTPIVLFPFLVTGCAPSQQEIMAKDRLEMAKGYYERVKSNPDVHTYAPADLYDA